MEKLDKVIAGMEACNGVGDDCNSCPYAGEGEKCSGVLWSDIMETLRNMEPVVHARWIDGMCSHCETYFSVNVNGEDITMYEMNVKRCPECGAHMDEEVAE